MTHQPRGGHKPPFKRYALTCAVLFLLIAGANTFPNHDASVGKSGHLAATVSSVSSATNVRTRINAVGITSGGKSITGRGVVIGIYDSGLNLDNPALITNGTSRVVEQACVGSSAEVNACDTTMGRQAQNMCSTTDIGCFHGMAVAGFAAGNNSTVTLDGKRVDVSGVAPDAHVSYIRDAMSKDGTIQYEDFVAALDKYVDDVKSGSPTAPSIINLSLGFPRDSYADCEQDSPSKQAIDFLVNSGVTIVAATGNESNKSEVTYPACMKNVIAVGSSVATRNADGSTTEKVSSFSNMSSDVDLVAPGEGQWGLLPQTSQFVTVSGTSFATPLVSGAIALIKQVKPSMTPSEIQDLLESTSDPVTDPATGSVFHELNVGNAIARISPSGSLAQAPVKSQAPQTQKVVEAQSVAQPKVVVPAVHLDSTHATLHATSVDHATSIRRPTQKSYIPWGILFFGGAGLILFAQLLIRRKRRGSSRAIEDALLYEPIYLDINHTEVVKIS